MKKICVLIPGYNCEKYLVDCFESILNQGYSDCQVIFINDGSTDKTDEIALKYKEIFSNAGLEYNYITCKTNKGQASAANIGLKYVDSEYFMWMDADDCLLEGCFKLFIECLDNNANINLCLGDVILKENNKEKLVFVNNKNDDYFYHILERRDAIYGPGTVCVRTSFLFSRLKDKSIYVCNGGQNIQFMLPILYKSKYLFLNKPTYAINVHPECYTVVHKSGDLYFQRELNFIKIFTATINNIKEIPETDKITMIDNVNRTIYINLYYRSTKDFERKKALNLYSKIKSMGFINKQIFQYNILNNSLVFYTLRRARYKIKKLFKRI